MDFGKALDTLKKGDIVTRSGWNGKGMWLVYLRGNGKADQFPVKTNGDWQVDEKLFSFDVERLPFIAMKTADNKVVPWLAAQSDLLATDWEIYSAGKKEENKESGKPSLPRWKCHKVVEAFKIDNVEPLLVRPGSDDTCEAAILYGFGYEAKVKNGYLKRNAKFGMTAIILDSLIGGYYVRYEDGYESFSPADIFESGYTRIENIEDPLPPKSE